MGGYLGADLEAFFIFLSPLTRFNSLKYLNAPTFEQP